jgi:hypothetical protein
MGQEPMWDEHACWVLYDGDDSPVGCDSIEEALNYVNAENIARGLPRVKRIQIVQNYSPLSPEPSDLPSDQRS